ncbi:MAG TPA: nitroreductase, partial [Anaerolineae bacterium]|nr:nitroreductase [Anaerolineae bacterium]
TFAPSAHNRQPWRFCIVRDADIKTKLADSMSVEFMHDLEKDGLPPEKIQKQVDRSKGRISSAPVIIVIGLDMTEMDVYTDAKRKIAEYTMAVQSVANAGMQILLAAHAEGLGGVWVCSPLFVPKTIQNILALQASWEPQGMFYLGYPDVIPNVRERKSLDEITLYL